MVNEVWSQSQEAPSFFQLFQYDATMLMSPVPGMFQKFITGEVCLLIPCCASLFTTLASSGNGGMVGTGHPARIVTAHTGTTDQNILNGIVKHVAHVKHTVTFGGGITMV